MNNNKEEILQALDLFFESGDKKIFKIIDKENNFNFDIVMCNCNLLYRLFRQKEVRRGFFNADNG